MHQIIKTAYDLRNTNKLINRFPINNGKKVRWVNNPIDPLKTALQEWNYEITNHYVDELKSHDLVNQSQAYLPKKSIKTNAKLHQHSSKIIKFDFSKFYDSVKFEYLEDIIRDQTGATTDELKLISRLIIDPETGGVTQGLPVSGAFAGLTLIPFWKELKYQLENTNIQFTQYSDDLTFSKITNGSSDMFNVDDLTQVIEQALIDTNREFYLNNDKTVVQKNQFRKITGVRINHNNQLSCSRKDYRNLRTIAYVLSKEDNTDEVLKQFKYKSKSSFIGKVSYMRSIDETGKIDKLINKYSTTFLKHNLFKTWIHQQESIFG